MRPVGSDIAGFMAEFDNGVHHDACDQQEKNTVSHTKNM